MILALNAVDEIDHEPVNGSTNSTPSGAEMQHSLIAPVELKKAKAIR